MRQKSMYAIATPLGWVFQTTLGVGFTDNDFYHGAPLVTDNPAMVLTRRTREAIERVRMRVGALESAVVELTEKS